MTASPIGRGTLTVGISSEQWSHQRPMVAPIELRSAGRPALGPLGLLTPELVAECRGGVGVVLVWSSWERSPVYSVRHETATSPSSRNDMVVISGDRHSRGKRPTGAPRKARRSSGGEGGI